MNNTWEPGLYALTLDGSCMPDTAKTFVNVPDDFGYSEKEWLALDELERDTIADKYIKNWLLTLLDR